MNDTPTPRTDEIMRKHEEDFGYSDADFSNNIKQLETELTAAREELHTLRAELHTLQDEVHTLGDQRDRLAEALRGFRKIHSELWDHGYVAAEAIAADEALQSLNQSNEDE